MKKRVVRYIILLFLILGFVCVSPSQAIDRDDVSSLGCSDGIVNIGDSKSDVYYLTFSRDRLERVQTGGFGN